MRDLHGVSMAAITVVFLAGLRGVFIVRSALQADRRLVVAGFRTLEAVLPRLAVLAAAVHGARHFACRHRLELHTTLVACLCRWDIARGPDLRVHSG